VCGHFLKNQNDTLLCQLMYLCLYLERVWKYLCIDKRKLIILTRHLTRCPISMTDYRSPLGAKINGLVYVDRKQRVSYWNELLEA